jgi:hypothetical protein
MHDDEADNLVFERSKAVPWAYGEAYGEEQGWNEAR